MKNSEHLHSEASIQQECVVFYTNAYCLAHHSPRCMIFSVPNSGNPRLVMTGTLAGVSDLIVIHRNILDEMPRILFIEIKTPTGLQSKQQKEFQHRVEEIGFEYHIVRSVTVFKEIIGSIK